MAEFNITDPEINKMLEGLTEEGRQDVADQIQESLDSGEVKKMVENKMGDEEREMIITEKEFEAIESALYVAAEEGMLLPEASGAFDKMRQIYKRYRWFIDSLEGFDPSELMREYQEEFGEDGEEK